MSLIVRAAACAAAVALIAAPIAMAQQTAPSSVAGAPAPGVQEMKVVIQTVVGMVAVSTDDGKTWRPAKAGMVLNEGAQFRTGLRSSVTCTIPPDQTFKLETLGTLRVAEAIKRGTKIKTDLILKYGATSYGIEAAGAEHDATIRSPSSTLAVRGTIVRLTDQPPFTPTAESFTGRAVYVTAQRQTRLGGKSYAIIRADQGTAAQTALDKTVVDPAAARARSDSEARLIANQTSLGAVASFDERANIAVVRGGAGPVSDADLAGSLPGKLDFVVRWTANADLNINVTDQPITAADIKRGQSAHLPPPTPATPTEYGQIGILLSGLNLSGQELLYPGYGLNNSPSGGEVPFDHRGGPKGGTEYAFWQGTPPSGVYGLGVLHISGATTPFTLNAFLDGKPLSLYGLDDLGNSFRTLQYTGTLGPGGGDDVLVFVPGNTHQETLSGPVQTQALQRMLAGASQPRPQALSRLVPSVATLAQPIVTGPQSLSTVMKSAAIVNSAPSVHSAASAPRHARGR